MMILSRIWYVILALLIGASFYVVSLAVGQYNRRNQAAMDETLKADSQVVSWALQVDARRRLDALLLAAVDPGIAKALRGANGKDSVPVGSRDEAVRALRAYNDRLEKQSPDYKYDVLFAADREGRLVGQLGYDALNAFPEFELGGYAAVFDALHGFLRDDTWVFGGRIARVVTRPVEDEVGQPPIGAVVGLRWVDNGFAKEIGKRTRTNLAFFALGQRVASAATTEGFDENSLEALGADLKAVVEDKQFKETGRTDVRPLGTEGMGGVLFVRLPGDAWELGGGFAVARPRVSMTSPFGFISGADDQDKHNVKFWLIGLLALGGAGLGLLFSVLEHSLPMRQLARQADALKKGDIDVLQVPKFSGGYRPIAMDINAGIQRVIEKGGGQARKPADLESILGPVPAQPNMSAFAFGQQPQQDVNLVPPPPGPPAPNRPQGPPSRPGLPRPPGAPPPPGPPSAFGSTVAMANAPASLAGYGPGGQPHTNAHSATVAAAGPVPPTKGTPNAFRPTPPGGLPSHALEKEEDEATMVAQPSADLIAAAGVNDAPPEWKLVYEEFLRTKRECGEPTDGLTYDKFQQTLKKNRDSLMQRHGCKRVKFSVYVKEGRASLKATPVRD